MGTMMNRTTRAIKGFFIDYINEQPLIYYIDFKAVK